MRAGNIEPESSSLANRSNILLLSGKLQSSVIIFSKLHTLSQVLQVPPLLLLTREVEVIGIGRTHDGLLQVSHY